MRMVKLSFTEPSPVSMLHRGFQNTAKRHTLQHNDAVISVNPEGKYIGGEGPIQSFGLKTHGTLPTHLACCI